MWILIIAVYFLIIIYGSASINSGFFMPVVCKAKTSDKIISLTFDDGPSENTNSILDMLKNHNIKATFFCIGKNIVSHLNIVKRISDEGHILGNHSYSHHFLFDFFSADRIKIELLQVNNILENIVKNKNKIFRPPYGITNPNIAQAVRDLNLTTIGWSIKSCDTVIKNEKKLLKKVTGKIHPGAIVLFHDTSSATKNILADFLEIVKKQGYQVVPINKLLNITVNE